MIMLVVMHVTMQLVTSTCQAIFNFANFDAYKMLKNMYYLPYVGSEKEYWKICSLRLLYWKILAVRPA